MNWSPSFTRKVIYIVAMIPPLLLIAWLGMPATTDSSGGRLSQLRLQHNLSQAKLGEIDPASETMRLATVGMQGIAANILWTKAIEYKKKEDWDNVSATLKQITKLQPNFLSVWEFQGHNLSYNISVEFDDYRHRYQWVVKGIQFLMEGTRFNTREPRLMGSVAWFFGQKIGIADEHQHFRLLFREDLDFHKEIGDHVPISEALGIKGKGLKRVDNWLVARLWYLKAQRLVDELGKQSLRGKNPFIFHSSPAMSQINYASALQEDFRPDEASRIAWRKALREWRSFGDRAIPSTWGYPIKLNEKVSLEQQITELQIKLDALVAGMTDDQIQAALVDLRKYQADLNAKEEEYSRESAYPVLQEKYPELGTARQRIAKQKQDSLSPQQSAALKVPVVKMTPQQASLAREAQEKLVINFYEIITEAPKHLRPMARRTVAEIRSIEERIQRIDTSRSPVNYEYWEVRCLAESSMEALVARQKLYDAQQAYNQGRLTASIDEEGNEQPGAKELYEESWRQWAKLFANHPILMKHHTAEDLVPSIVKYRRMLGVLNEKFPEDFPLNNLLEIYKQNHANPFLERGTPTPSKTQDDTFSPKVPAKTGENDAGA